jgi:hypothetical protein
VARDDSEISTMNQTQIQHPPVPCDFIPRSPSRSVGSETAVVSDAKSRYQMYGPDRLKWPIQALYEDYLFAK